MAELTRTLAELTAQNLSVIERHLNTQTPLSDKAFNRVLAVTLAIVERQMYAYLADRAMAVNTVTARGTDLDDRAEGYGVYRNVAQKWIGSIDFPMMDGGALLMGTVFVSDAGMKYTVQADAYADAGGIHEARIAANEVGSSANLSVGDRLTIQTPVSGAGMDAVVAEVLSMGVEGETDEEFRKKILSVQRNDTSEGTAGAARSWAEAVDGVARAYPYSGRPAGAAGDSLPGERTVYVEARKSIDPDGVPPQALLDLVKQALLKNPADGSNRLMLGQTAEGLYVRPISRIPVYVTIAGLVIENGDISVARRQVEESVSRMLESVEPYVEGVDPEQERNDKLTESLLMRETQNIIDRFGGTVQNILFGREWDSNTGRIDLNRNEKLKLGGILFTDI
jgi:hypothetical protein